jgi:hypothetical protein
MSQALIVILQIAKGEVKSPSRSFRQEKATLERTQEAS